MIYNFLLLFKLLHIAAPTQTLFETSVLVWVVSASTNRKWPVPKNMFLSFNAEITPVHWSLIITAYVTLSHALSCNRLLQKPFRGQTKGPLGSQQRETNSSRHVQYCCRGHNKPGAACVNKLRHANRATCCGFLLRPLLPSCENLASTLKVILMFLEFTNPSGFCVKACEHGCNF